MYVGSVHRYMCVCLCLSRLVCVLAQQSGISAKWFSMCVYVSACVCVRENCGPMRAGISRGTQEGGQTGHVTTGSHRGRWAVGNKRGSVLGPMPVFIVCVGCLSAEYRQINPETSASTHKHKPGWTSGRTEAALCRLVSGN